MVSDPGYSSIEIILQPYQVSLASVEDVQLRKLYPKFFPQTPRERFYDARWAVPTSPYVLLPSCW